MLTTAERSSVTKLAHATVSPDQRYLILCREKEIWIVPLGRQWRDLSCVFLSSSGQPSVSSAFLLT